MEQLFKIGDVVTLKSGGEKMTIIDDKTSLNFTPGDSFDEEYKCSWFEAKKLKFAFFPKDAIMKA